MCAEESTAWEGTTAPTEWSGLGFDLKWNMGWMHDTLRYLGEDPLDARRGPRLDYLPSMVRLR